MAHEFRLAESGLSHRREFLCAGSAALLGLTLPQLLAGRAAFSVEPEANSSDVMPGFGRAKACILLFMWGGPAHQDTWDLKPDAPVEVRGEFKPIATSVPGIQICEHFPLLAKQTQRLAIIRSMTHTDVEHTTATHFLLTGQPPPSERSADFKKDWPHLGAVLSHQGRGRGPLPPFVSMRPKLENDVPRFVEESHGQFAGWLGPAYNPLMIDADPSRSNYRVGEFERPRDISEVRLQERERLLTALERQHAKHAAVDPAMWGRHRRKAFELLAGAADARAFKLAEEPQAVRERYGLNPHGQSVLQARRLIERGVPLVTVFWPNDGIKNVSVYWDTHSRNFIDLRERLMPAADRAFTALLDDLQDRGLLDETLVIWTGEFGRTPRVGQRNSDAGAAADGRDHWPGCFTTVLAGGGVKGGVVYGASDRHAAYPAADAVAPVDLVATVYSLLGINPHLTLHDTQGRPLVICPGTPVRALVS